MTLLRRSLLATALVAAAGLAHAADDTGVPKGPLPRNVVPSLVQLELKLDPKQANFSGKTRIQARVAEATDVIWMHGRGLKISKAEAIVGGMGKARGGDQGGGKETAAKQGHRSGLRGRIFRAYGSGARSTYDESPRDRKRAPGFMNPADLHAVEGPRATAREKRRPRMGPSRAQSVRAAQNFCWYCTYRKRPMSKPP